MKSILKKIFKSQNELSNKDIIFIDLQKKLEIKKIFESISNYSDESELRFVGGCVRKILNNEKIDDIDLATNIDPENISKALKNNNIDFYETGIAHGTITAIINGQKFEITSLRKDILTDGRHAKVQFSKNWKDDASRRDFTINAIYADIDGNLFDPFDGRQDIKDGKVIFIGDAGLRIKEDYLRILRYVRFFLNYSKIEHDKKIIKLIRQNIIGVRNLSKERLLDELKKLVLSNDFFKIANDDFCSEIILLIFPQLKNLSIMKNLNNDFYKEISSKDFIFLLSLMIVDETDNAEYFLYKFNISNEDKKRIKFLNSIFSKPIDKSLFCEKNLWKIFYYNGINYLNDMLNFQIFKSKKNNKQLLKLKKFFNSQTPPIFPIQAKNLINNYKLKEGKQLGIKLKKLETIWIDNDFKITEKEIDKVVNN